MIRRALRRLRREEAGLGMSELLVSAMLTIIIMSMVAALFVQTAKITAASSQTTNSNGVASNVANEITSVLRVATTLPVLNQPIASPAIISGTRSSIQLYSLSNTSADNPAPVKVTITRDNTTKAVSETRCTAVATAGFWTFSPCAATTTRTLGIGVQAPTGVDDQLFTYYDVNGVAMAIGEGSLDANQLKQVAKIKVQVFAVADKSYTKPVQITNMVVLGNLGLDTSTT